MRQYYSPQQLHQASPLPPLSSESYQQYSPQEITPFNYPQYLPEPQHFPPSFPYNQQQIQQQQQQYFPYPGQFEINQPAMPSSFPQSSQIYPHNFQQQLQQSPPPPVYPPPPPPYFNQPNFVRQAQNINFQSPFLQPPPNEYPFSQPQPILPWNNTNTANYINKNQPFPIAQPMPSSSFKASSDSKTQTQVNIPRSTFNYDNQSIFNPITQKRTKRSLSENNNNNTSLNRKHNPAIPAANLGSPIKDQRDQLGRALAGQIEDRKRREAAEKEENRKQELNLLNYNLNNSPFIKHSLNHQENLRRRMRENSPQRLPSIGGNRPINQGDSQNIQQFNDRMQYPNNIQSNNYQDYQNIQQYQQQYQQPFERFDVVENNFTQNNRKQQISLEKNKQPRQLESRDDGNALQEQEKMSKHEKLIEYQRFLQQQIKDLNEKKKQEKERKRQEELRLQREFEQQRIQQLLREQQQQLNAKEVRGGRRRIISQNIYPAIIEKQHQAAKYELDEGNDFSKEKEEEERLLSNKSKQKIIKEQQLSYEDAFSEGSISGNTEDQRQRLDDIPQVRDQEVAQIDRGMMNMINMLSENQLRIQNVLSQIKHSSEESTAQNQMQFANIQEMLKSHHNNRGYQQQQKQQDVEGTSQNGNSSSNNKENPEDF